MALVEMQAVREAFQQTVGESITCALEWEQGVFFQKLSL